MSEVYLQVYDDNGKEIATSYATINKKKIWKIYKAINNFLEIHCDLTEFKED